MTSSHLFMLFLLVLISNPSNSLSVMVFASKLCVVLEQTGEENKLEESFTCYS